MEYKEITEAKVDSATLSGRHARHHAEEDAVCVITGVITPSRATSNHMIGRCTKSSSKLYWWFFRASLSVMSAARALKRLH